MLRVGECPTKLSKIGIIAEANKEQASNPHDKPARQRHLALPHGLLPQPDQAIPQPNLTKQQKLPSSQAPSPSQPKENPQTILQTVTLTKANTKKINKKN